MSVSNNTRFGGILRPFRENNYARAVLGPLHPLLCCLYPPGNNVQKTYDRTIGSGPGVEDENMMIYGKLDDDDLFEFGAASTLTPEKLITLTKRQVCPPAPKKNLETAELACLLTGTLFLATVLFGIVQLAGIDLQTVGLVAHAFKNSGIPLWSRLTIALVSTLSVGFICAAIENKRRKDSCWENDFPGCNYLDQTSD